MQSGRGKCCLAHLKREVSELDIIVSVRPFREEEFGKKRKTGIQCAVSKFLDVECDVPYYGFAYLSSGTFIFIPIAHTSYGDYVSILFHLTIKDEGVKYVREPMTIATTTDDLNIALSYIVEDLVNLFAMYQPHVTYADWFISVEGIKDVIDAIIKKECKGKSESKSKSKSGSKGGSGKKGSGGKGKSEEEGKGEGKGKKKKSGEHKEGKGKEEEKEHGKEKAKEEKEESARRKELGEEGRKKGTKEKGEEHKEKQKAGEQEEGKEEEQEGEEGHREGKMKKKEGEEKGETGEHGERAQEEHGEEEHKEGKKEEGGSEPIIIRRGEGGGEVAEEVGEGEMPEEEEGEMVELNDLLSLTAKGLYKLGKAGYHAGKTAVKKGVKFTKKTGGIYRQIGESIANPALTLKLDSLSEDARNLVIEYIKDAYLAYDGDLIADLFYKLYLDSKMNPYKPRTSKRRSRPKLTKLEDSKYWDAKTNSLVLLTNPEENVLYVPDFVAIPYYQLHKTFKPLLVNYEVRRITKVESAFLKVWNLLGDIKKVELINKKPAIKLKESDFRIGTIWEIRSKIYSTKIYFLGVSYDVEWVSKTESKNYFMKIPKDILALISGIRTGDDEPALWDSSEEFGRYLAYKQAGLSDKYFKEYESIENISIKLLLLFKPEDITSIMNRIMNDLYIKTIKKNPSSKDFIKKASRTLGIAKYMLEHGSITEKDYQKVYEKVMKGLKKMNWNLISDLYSQFMDEMRGYPIEKIEMRKEVSKMVKNPHKDLEFVYLAKGTEIALDDGRIIKFNKKKPLMLKPKGRNELWFVFPEYKRKRAFKPDEQSIREYEMFNMTGYDGNNYIIGIDIDMNRLKKVGSVRYEGYISPKEGAMIRYLHEHKRPYPVLYSDPNGKVFVIKGGMLKIREWLYH